ncbi:hypothetical protein ACFOD4_13975 [Pseudoroseomonas globiformis]|uniref:Chemotaxis protein n=1 Tax=Teichococcus globiformis TaxID=2307229 RepID=A0ABV7G570_9PROT
MPPDLRPRPVTFSPTSAELAACLDWRWKAALFLVAASPAALLLPAAQAPWAAAFLLGCASLLALFSAAQQMRYLLEADPVDSLSEDPLIRLQALLESQQGQMHEAAAAVSRSVTAGAQLAGLTRNVEQRCRWLLEHDAVQPQPQPSASLLEEIRASLALDHEAMAATQARIEAALSQRLDELLHRVGQLSTTQQGNNMLQDELSTLQAMSHGWAAQIEHAAYREASLGDAARYLTETADRLRDGTQAVERHAVRLQALISMSTHRQDGAAVVQAGLLTQLETMLQQAASPGSAEIPAIADAPRGF